MPIYIYKGNSQISTNAIRNTKVVKAIYAKEQGKDAVCVWGSDDIMIFTYTVTDNKITITGLKQNKEPTSLTIPAQIEGVPVTAIAPNTFRNKYKIKEIVIPNSITSIGDSAYYGCSGLTSMTIPFVGAKASVTSSDTYQYPFGYIFGTSSYDGGVATKQYYYGNSTSSTTSTTYYIPSSLKSVTVMGGNILFGAFSYCTGLTSITIGNGVTSIGSWAFRDCTGLTSITIGNGVTSIGESAFLDCSSLTSITIGNSVTRIGLGAFQGCTGLTSITIPDSVTSINLYAFSGCTGLTTVNWNATECTNAGSRDYPIFIGCSNLATVNIGDNVKIIPPYAFQGCTGLTNITFNGTKAQWNAISKGANWDSNTGNYTIHCTDGDISKS